MIFSNSRIYDYKKCFTLLFFTKISVFSFFLVKNKCFHGVFFHVFCYVSKPGENLVIFQKPGENLVIFQKPGDFSKTW